MIKKLLLLVVLFNFNSVVLSQNDSIRLSNNNLLVGELKELDKSVLSFDTDYADKDFKIKWGEIVEIYSSRNFIINLTNGDRFSSTINSDPNNKSNVLVVFAGKKQSIALSDVILLEPIASSFFNRLEGAFDIGFTLTKTNNLRQVTSNFSLNYLAYKWDFSSKFNLVYSQQDNIENVNRWSGNITAERAFVHNWFFQIRTDLLSNTEQKLKLRNTTGLGAGYYLKRNNNLSFNLSGGFAYNNEQFSNTEDINNSMEGYLGLTFNKYDIGDLSLLTSLRYFPSITDSGRNRIDFNFTMKYDLPLDFYIKTEITYNFDNQPTTGASKEDYVFQTTFGWSFN